MADTIRKMLDMTSVLFKDGQTAGAITPQDVRDLLETMKTQFSFSTNVTQQTITIVTQDVYEEIISTDSHVATEGITRDGPGVYSYDSVGTDSVVPATNNTRSFFGIGFGSFECGTAAREMTIAFSVNDSILTHTQMSHDMLTANKANCVVFGGLLKDLTLSDKISAEIKNLGGSEDILVNNLQLCMIGLND